VWHIFSCLVWHSRTGSVTAALISQTKSTQQSPMSLSSWQLEKSTPGGTLSTTSVGGEGGNWATARPLEIPLTLSSNDIAGQGIK